MRFWCVGPLLRSQRDDFYFHEHLSNVESVGFEFPERCESGHRYLDKRVGLIGRLIQSTVVH